MVSYYLGRHHVELFRHAAAGDHATSDASSLLDIVRRAAGDAAEDELFGAAAAGDGDNFVKECLLFHQHAVVLINLHGVAQRTIGAWNNRNLVHRRAILLHRSHQCMADFVVGDNLLFFGADDSALALVASDNNFNGFLQISLLHHLALQLDGAQRALVDDVGQLGAAGAGGGTRERFKIDIIRHLHIARMHS